MYYVYVSFLHLFLIFSFPFPLFVGMLPVLLLAGLILALSIPGTSSESATLRFLGQTDFVVNESSTAVVRLVVERVGDPVNVTALVLVRHVTNLTVCLYSSTCQIIYSICISSPCHAAELPRLCPVKKSVTFFYLWQTVASVQTQCVCRNCLGSH